MAQVKHNVDLRVQMLEAGVTQKQVAEALGVRRDYLSRALSVGQMTDKFRDRVLSAIEKLKVSA